MALKNSITTADYIDFNTASNVANKLLKDKKTAFLGRYIIIAINTGLRNSDIRELTFDDLQTDKITIREKKTNKPKTIAINENIKSIIPSEATGKMFVSKKGDTVTIQHLNLLLKKVFNKESKSLNISSHSLRKSFGRRVYDNNNESEKALVYLSELFNHSSIAVTRKYLGLRQNELNDIYMSL